MLRGPITRRYFVSCLGGAAAWPLSAGAQQPERMRRIGVLMNTVSDDAEGQARLAAFHQGLQQLGWTVGHNVRIDYRWGGDDAERIRRGAAELVALGSDVILASATPSVAALQEATRTIPTERFRPCRRRVCRKPGATGQQCDRLYALRIRLRCKMAGTT